MTYRFFAIPAFNPAFAEAELNHLLAASRVLNVERHFVADGEASFWAICLSLAPGPGALPDGLKAELLRAKGLDLPKTMDQTRHPAGAACRGGELQGARGAGRRTARMPAPTAPRVADPLRGRFADDFSSSR